MSSSVSCEAQQLYAHTPNVRGEWHALTDHLDSVGHLAERFANAFGAADVARLVGRLHDVGKASGDFQCYLRKCWDASQANSPAPRKSVDHKTAGAVAASAKCEVAVLPILGHHGGLSEPSAARSMLARANADQALRMLAFTELGTGTPVLPAFVRDAPSTELFVRMLFSALVDADFLDTERHWAEEKADLRTASYSVLKLWEVLRSNQESLLSGVDDCPVNRVRREIYDACVAAADLPQGVFRLTVPTGGGKTRSGMAFGLKHALRHGLDRVIVAIPYTSIIDQNASVYREILGADNVLEHHSAIELDDDEYSERQLRLSLAAENWDMPVVVTTTVQLFESLFSNKPSRCRKLHNIARSVIILDEVQTLPVGLLTPILDVLRELVASYGVTLVLSTATQPAFSGESPYLKGFTPEPTEIVSEPRQYFDALKRVEYEVESAPWSWEQVAEKMRCEKQALCVVNSRRDALALFGLLDEDALHLSTLMCPMHRREVLDEIRRRLAAGEECRVVSTQVVEAGVDVDLPFVMRAMGPLDRIAQAAGRCNREGKLDQGRVIVFTPEDGHVPRGVYETALAESMRALAMAGCDLHAPDVFDAYFRSLWMSSNLDTGRIAKLRERLNYPETAARFRMISDDTVPVVVAYGDGADEVVGRVRRTGFASRRDWRLIQPYTVSIFRRQFERYLGDGMIETIIDGLYLWAGSYSSRTGILEQAMDPGDLVT